MNASALSLGPRAAIFQCGLRGSLHLPPILPLMIPASRRRIRFVTPVFLLLASCLVLVMSDCRNSGAEHSAPAAARTIRAFDSVSVRRITVPVDTALRPLPPARLSPLADSISGYMTFLARIQRMFVAASRAKRLLVDVGRVDTKVTTPARVRAFEQAAKELSPLRMGDTVLLRGPWGATDATISGYEPWNGRITATLDLPPDVDSLAHEKETLVAVAMPTDSATAPVADTCSRAAPDPALAARVNAVRDSLTKLVQADTAGWPPSAIKSERVHASQAMGCFGPARVLLFVNASGDAAAFVRESAVLLDSAGAVIPLAVLDRRFRAHDAIRAFDADGDGVDDVAALGRADRVGGTVVLRLDLAKKRLEYVMSGFSWENF